MSASRSRRVFICSALVVLLVLIGLFAAACGDTEEETTTTSAATATTAGEATTTTAAPTTDTTAAEATTTTAAAPEEFVFGTVYVGPYNDGGWSQANHEGGLYIEEKMPGARMVYVDKANTADRPGTTIEQLGESLLAEGAQMIFFTSDDMKDGAITFAQTHPEIPVVHTSGDGAWTEGKDFKNLPNLSNIMGKMEYGKMIAGCAAAMTTQTGKIGYLGPLINDETRRLASSSKSERKRLINGVFLLLTRRRRTPSRMSSRAIASPMLPGNPTITIFCRWMSIPNFFAMHASDFEFYRGAIGQGKYKVCCLVCRINGYFIDF